MHGGVLPVDKSQRRLEEVLDLLAQEHRVRVVVDWKNGEIRHEDLLCVMQCGHAHRRVGSRLGLCDESVVRLIAPASVVVSATRYPHVQERVGVHVITNPARTRNRVVEVCPVIHVDTPLLGLQGALDSKVLGPHLLDRLGNGFVPGGGIVEQHEGREALAIGIAGLSKQRLCSRDIVVLVEGLLGGLAEIGARKRVWKAVGNIA